MVLAGGAAALCRGLPADANIRCTARCRCRRSSRRCWTCEAEGRLDRVRDARPDQLHLRRPHVQHAPGDGGMPRHQARPDLPVGRSLVRLCALVAVPAPAHGDGRRRRRSRTGCASPASVEAYETQQAELGDKSRPTRRCSKTRLIPDPRKVRLRVYQTNSTHKSMSAHPPGLDGARCKDVDFHTVESQFHEAVFTHASTSPNQQLIASLDVARRQMELEGYGLVMNAIEIALTIRAAVEQPSADLEILPGSRRRRDDARRSSASRGFVDFLAPGTNWGDMRQGDATTTSSASIRPA